MSYRKPAKASGTAVGGFVPAAVRVDDVCVDGAGHSHLNSDVHTRKRIVAAVRAALYAPFALPRKATAVRHELGKQTKMTPKNQKFLG